MEVEKNKTLDQITKVSINQINHLTHRITAHHTLKKLEVLEVYMPTRK
jgi:hypothetical protein